MDHEINGLFSARKEDVRLVLISDSVHSGTATRAAAADRDAEDAPRPRFMPMGKCLPAGRFPRGMSGQPLSTVPVTSGTSPFAGALSRKTGDLLPSGCREGPHDSRYDARIVGGVTPDEGRRCRSPMTRRAAQADYGSRTIGI
ncbi:hypothetical protein [Accumulibacter sp.]|uniref:hypothetical protein n=1 Tax=Accumulibacter sp. TaxID=2053492 RepID=UPI0025F17156|nr:hypothetical protein [Accumulibacter sp.]MCM8596661.1 hypothetical protein [Accumulibacter sp.]MCM8627671.1 hypothetical protein [Accumulibacter sp.]MDS4050809.1 hypothetical protein [Accumulibacter sp.]